MPEPSPSRSVEASSPGAGEAPHGGTPTDRPAGSPGGGAGTDPEDGPGYLAGVLAEIDAEVRRRRASGDLPAGLERELDELFLEFSPVGLQGKARLRENLALVDGAAFVDISVPVESRKRAGTVVKRLIRKSMGWYIGFIVQQIVKFAWSVSRMLHLLVDHVEGLEAAAEAERTPDLPETAVPAPAPGGWWADRVVAELQGTRGRVLDADCGDGQLVAALVGAGVDAYGVDPSGPLVELAVARGLDVRTDSLLDHLEVVGEESLAAIVLHGSVQWLHPGQRDRLADLVSSRLTLGGMLLLHSATPEAWQRDAPPLVVDLAPGRPLHAETWEFLLQGRGLGRIGLHAGPVDPPLSPVVDDTPEATALNAAIAALNALRPASADYLLVTVRSR